MRQQLSVWVLGLCLGTSWVSAQTVSGEIAGTVYDSTRAAIPGALVNALHHGTNATFQAVSGDLGRFVLPHLPVGLYTLSVEMPGFKRFLQGPIQVNVNQRVSLQIFLQVGEMNEEVRVEADAPLLEAETSDRGQVIKNEVLADLPLNRRDYTQLATLVPGVLTSTSRLKGSVNVNGNRTTMNNYQLDGVDNNSYASSYRGENVQVLQPQVDAIQEFKVMTGNYSAEFGRSAGAVIQVAVKSGTNEIHGSLFEFHRNQALDARNTFAVDKPDFIFHQFGGTVGGPLVRDRLFYFGAFEGSRRKEGFPVIRTIPSRSLKQGIFLSPVWIVDRFTGQRLQQVTQIPRSAWDPVAARIVDLLPDPNVPGREELSNNYNTNQNETEDTNQYDVKIDYEAASRLRLFGRFSVFDQLRFKNGPFPGLAEGSTNDGFGTTDTRAYQTVFGATGVFSSTLIGDFRLGFSRLDARVFPVNFGQTPGVSELLGIPNVPSSPEIDGGLPKIQIRGFSDFGRHTSTPQFQTPEVWDLRATLTWNREVHSLKFGANLQFLQVQILDISAPVGRLRFRDRPAFSGHFFGDFLQGLPTAVRLTTLHVPDQGQDGYFFFVQDDWKVAPRFTLNLGLRYEYSTWVKEAQDRMANFDPSTASLVFAGQDSEFGRSLIRPDRNNFAPRLGFAYSLARGTVLRAGYGVFYNHFVRMGREGLLGMNPPFLVDKEIQKLGNSTVPIFRLSEGFPADFLTTFDIQDQIVRMSPLHQRSTYVQGWNFSLQRELASDLLLDVGYVASKGNKIPGLRNLNQLDPARGLIRPFPDFGDIQALENNRNSIYHSLQVKLEKRFSGGLGFLGSYTFGKVINDVTENQQQQFGFDRSPQNAYDLRSERGLGEFDRRHRFVFSGIYQIPFDRSGSAPAWLRALLENWQINGILQLTSGNALTLVTSGTNLGQERDQRPNVTGNPNKPPSQRTREEWFDTSKVTASEFFGNAGRGIIEGPGFASLDFSLFRSFPLGEERAVEFRAEMFNAFNRTNLGSPVMGRTSGGFGSIVQAEPARQIQFGLKILF